MNKLRLLIAMAFISGCVVVPMNEEAYVSECEISTDKKTLRVINVAKETNSYYSLEGIMATPILYPTTALISGIYVTINNIYNAGEEKIVCK